jgi:pimeloyl-ACP methyl ester carboxylesterase
MKTKLLALWLFAIAALFAQAADTLPPAAPPYYRVRYEGSTVPGELLFGVSYTIWIPPGVKTVRGIVVHQHGCGEGACKAGETAAFDLHWQALAAKHECALLGPSYEQPEKENCGLWCDPRNGSEKKYLQALNDLAAKSGHAELTKVPWALWGHSGGAVWAGNMLLMHPERIAAVWLRSGSPRLLSREATNQPPLEIPIAAYQVPVMCNLGTREGVTQSDPQFARVWETVKAFFTGFRAKGGLIGVAVDPKSSHDCGNSRYLAMPWFDACLEARLPSKSSQPLKPMPVRSSWLAPLLGTNAFAKAHYPGDPNTAVWLPNKLVAQDWIEYSVDANVHDRTGPPAPTDLKLTGYELTWHATADVESGIGGFLIECNGQEIGRVPAKPAGSVGRPIFQRNGYSDTPTPPLAEMRFTVPAGEEGKKQVFRVRTLNSTGLKSGPCTLRVLHD